MLIGKNGALAGHYQIRRGEFADMKGKKELSFLCFPSYSAIVPLNVSQVIFNLCLVAQNDCKCVPYVATKQVILRGLCILW